MSDTLGSQDARARRLAQLIETALTGEPRGRTIGDVYQDLASTTDHDLIEVVTVFNALYGDMRIYIVNEQENPSPSMARWSIQ